MSTNRSPVEPHTLAQLARRARLASSRARALNAEGRLPAPDLHDADGRPLWNAATIDAWCRTTDRKVADDAVWIYRVPDPSATAEELFHGMVEFVPYPGARTAAVFAKCWGTEHGHLVYVREVDGEAGDRGLDYAVQARAAAQVVAPRFWPDTLVLVDSGLPYRPNALEDPPDVVLNMYQLRTDETDAPDSEGISPEPETLRERVGRLLGRPATIAPEPPPRPHATAVRGYGSPEATDVARVIGTPTPTWIRGTCRREAIDRARAYSGTFTVPDTASAWQPTLERLKAAHRKLAGSHPAAFALLAADAIATLAEVRNIHTQTRQRGPGWYLVARPAAPALPLDLELELAGLPKVTDLAAEQIMAELAELRHAEANLPAADDGEGDALAHAVALLTIAAESIDPHLAVDTIIVEAGTMDGEAADQWRSTLRRHPDPDHVWNTRRGRRLLEYGHHTPDDVRELLVDHGDRLIALVPSRAGGLDFIAEWPTGLPSGWNETTIIVGDHDEGRGYGPVLALTPTAEGLRADLVPAPPGSSIFGGFTWGYAGGGPSQLYEALVRVACAIPLGLSDEFRAPYDSELSEIITTTEGPLRVRWADVLAWARRDVPPEDRGQIGERQ